MKKFILVLAAMAVSGVAVAGPSWTYGQVDYGRADSGDEDSENYRLMGSFGFADKYHVQASYFDGEVEGGDPTGYDFDGFSFILGVNPAVTDTTDFVFQILYFDYDIDFGSSSDDSVDGYGLGTGLRSQVTENVELHSTVWAISGDEDSGSSSSDFTDIQVVAGGQYMFTENIGLTIDYIINNSLFDDADSASFGVRWTF